MNEITTDTAVVDVAVAEAPALVYNAVTGEYEAVEVTVQSEGPVADAGDVTVH